MQVGIDVKCMHPSFGGRGFFDFGDMATFQKGPNITMCYIMNIKLNSVSKREGRRGRGREGDRERNKETERERLYCIIT